MFTYVTLGTVQIYTVRLIKEAKGRYMGNRKEEVTGRHFTRRFCGKYSQNMTEVSLPVAGENLYSP